MLKHSPVNTVDYGLGHKDSHCGKAFDDDKRYCRYFIPPSARQ